MNEAGVDFALNRNLDDHGVAGSTNISPNIEVNFKTAQESAIKYRSHSRPSMTGLASSVSFLNALVAPSCLQASIYVRLSHHGVYDV